MLHQVMENALLEAGAMLQDMPIRAGQYIDTSLQCLCLIIRKQSVELGISLPWHTLEYMAGDHGSRNLSKAGEEVPMQQKVTPVIHTSTEPHPGLTRVIHLSFLNVMQTGPSSTPLPVPFNATEPIAENCRFTILHK